MLILFVSRVGDGLSLVTFDLMKKDVLYPVHENKTGWGKILIFRYHISSKDGLVILYVYLMELASPTHQNMYHQNKSQLA